MQSSKRGLTHYRRRVTPSAWGWSVFEFSATVPTFIIGHMAATGLQFNPFRTAVGLSPWNSAARPYVSFNSRLTAPTDTAISSEVTSVGTAGTFGSGTTQTRTTTTVTVKRTTNRFTASSGFNFANSVNSILDSGSIESAIGRL
jgi:hypothetical protein